MPPWGQRGVFTPEDIVHLVAYLKTLQGNPPAAARERSGPQSRSRGAGRSASATISIPRTTRRCCGREARRPCGRERAGRARPARTATGGAESRMRGVATRYPQYVPAYQRVMAIEDFLSVHAPETTGTAHAVGERGQPQHDDADQDGLQRHAGGGGSHSSPEARAALARGRARSAAGRRAQPRVRRLPHEPGRRAPTSSSAGGCSAMRRPG